ncbi:TetR/AcrR family transcriptional regulator, partial [Staphylococcus aureus]
MLINIIFNNLKPEKQKTIVNASIKEFVKSGFDKASTNEIVKQ